MLAGMSQVVKNDIMALKKTHNVALVQQAESDLDSLVDKVMSDLDRPENGAWERSVIREVKGITSWHKQIDDLAEDLGTAITEDPDHLEKLNKIQQWEEKYDQYI